VLGDGSYASRLVVLLPKATDQDERKALEDALVATCGRLGEQQRIAPLLPSLESAEAPVRRVLLRVAGRVGTQPAVDVLVETLRDDNAEIRDAAMTSLADFPNDRAQPALLEVAKTTDDDDYRFLALRGYSRLAEKHRDNAKKLVMLREAMSLAKRPAEKKVVVRSMGSVRTADGLKEIVSHLVDAGIADDVGRAAIDVGNRIRGGNRDEVRKAMEQVIATAKANDVLERARRLLKQVSGE